MNPAPIKSEKVSVMWGSHILLLKEMPEETELTLDVKGIETVRRDGIPAQAKMTETR